MTDLQIHEALCDIDENARGLSAWESDFIESLIYADVYTERQREKALELIDKHGRGGTR